VQQGHRRSDNPGTAAWVGLAVCRTREPEGDGKVAGAECRGRMDDVVIGGAENEVSGHRHELEFLQVRSVLTQL
jgi:hypothetical protein